MTDWVSDEDILRRLGATSIDRLGAGNEAQVYALDDKRVARIARPGGRMEDAEARATLLREIASSAATMSFLTPIVLDVDLVAGRAVVIEQRLPGEPVSSLLGRLTGPARERLILSYLETSTKIRDVRVSRPYFGPLIGRREEHASRWSDFARTRAMQNVRRCPADLANAVAAEARQRWEEPERAALVHLDYFPANLLAEEDTVTAVLDFGSSSIIGDPHMDSWASVAYLDAEISPAANQLDRDLAQEWLDQQGLATGYRQAKRWLAAAWSFAIDDTVLMALCRRVLLGQ